MRFSGFSFKLGKAHFAWGECKIGRHGPIPMTVYDAEKAGYTPCARCFGD